MERLKKFFKKVYLTIIHYFNSEVKYRRIIVYYSLLSLCCLTYFNNFVLSCCLFCGFCWLDSTLYELKTKIKRKQYINITLKILLCLFMFFTFFTELFDSLVASKRTTKIHNIRRSAFYYTLDNDCVIFIAPNKKEMYCNIYHQIQYGKVKQTLITCKVSNKKTLFVFSPDEFVNYFNSEVVESFISSLGNNNKDLKNELLSILKQQKFNV